MHPRIRPKPIAHPPYGLTAEADIVGPVVVSMHDLLAVHPQRWAFREHRLALYHAVDREQAPTQAGRHN